MQRYTLLLSAVLLLGLALLTGFQPLYLLLYSLLLLTGLAYIWAWVQSKGLDLEISSLNSRPQVGHPFHMHVQIKETWGIPRLALRIRLPGRQSTETDLLFSLKPRETLAWTPLVSDHHRGENSFGTMTVTSTDPLGMVKRERSIGKAYSVLVYPNLIPLSPGMSVNTGALGDVGNVSPSFSASTSASRVREYAPGDSLSHIHWPYTARKEQLMTKEFDSGGHSDLWIFLDMQKEAHSGTGPDSTEEYSVTIAASLYKCLLETGQTVGIAAHGNLLIYREPQKDAQHLWQTLADLARIRTSEGASITNLVRSCQKALFPGNVAIVISPSFTGMASGLSPYLQRMGIRIAPIFISPFAITYTPDQSRSAPQGKLPWQGWTVKRGDNLSHTLSDVVDSLTYQ